jgi:hypothetical protein
MVCSTCGIDTHIIYINDRGRVCQECMKDPKNGNEDLTDARTTNTGKSAIETG